MNVHFELLSVCPHTKARRGRLHTPHGSIETPAFMPVGTQGTVKTVGSEDLEAMGYELVLSNTYHLALRPGSELVQGCGGLGPFMGWTKSLLTDSGGFQVMSLRGTSKVSEEGVDFASHINGDAMKLSPEKSIEIQAELGVDIAMAFDQCPQYPCSKDEAREAMERTHRWARRCLDARKEGQSILGIVQGGVHSDLREESLGAICAMPFDGFALGGVSVGEPTDLQRPVVAAFGNRLPEDKVRYLMGVGHPSDIIHGVASGIDIFDCVLPTRMARHGTLYTLKGRMNAGRAEFASQMSPYDPDSDFFPRYSPAYIRHLFKAKENLGPRLASLHNLFFYSRLMRELREAIESGTWSALIERYARA